MAAAEQNSREPQSIDAGVMNTDSTSMLNSPEQPTIYDEPTPRQTQLRDSAPSQEANAVNNSRASQLLGNFMRRVKGNPLKSAAAAAAGGLGVLGALPYDPRESE